jgi:hypothetical protein
LNWLTNNLQIDSDVLEGNAQRQVLPASAGFGGKMPKSEPGFRG